MIRHIRRRAGILVVPAAILLLSGCNLQQNLADHAGQSPASGQQAPHFTGTLLGGGSFDSASITGKVTVVDFWASWCGPCRAEQPDLDTIAGRYMPRGVGFVGVAVRDDAAAAQSYRHDFNVPYPSLDDSSQQIAAGFQIVAPPTTVVLDRQGHIAGQFLGTTAGLSDLLDQLLR